MALQQHEANGTRVLYKVIQGKVDGRQIQLGIAFRTMDAPIGYLPFYGANDFDFSGETTLKEQLMARLPMDLSAAGSPHTLLLKEAAHDLEFLGSGEADLPDIQQLVRFDLTKHAMTAASGVFVDGVMLALGGPTIKGAVGMLLKSKVQQFIVSKSISAAAKSYLKASGNDVSPFLSKVP